MVGAEEPSSPPQAMSRVNKSTNGTKARRRRIEISVSPTAVMECAAKVF
jgi:hypothetical protein